MFRLQSTGLSVGVGIQSVRKYSIRKHSIPAMFFFSLSSARLRSADRPCLNGHSTFLDLRPVLCDGRRHEMSLAPRTPPGNVTLGQIYHPHTTTAAAPPVPAPRTPVLACPSPITLIHTITGSSSRVSSTGTCKNPPLDTTAIWRGAPFIYLVG